MIRVEICTDSLEGARAAQLGGAHRVELCTNLSEGGVTPSAACIELTRRELKIPIHLLIRPRPGDFLYSPAEIEGMLRDIEIARDLRCDGVVLGCLTELGDIDLPLLDRLIQQARPLSVTFHRAFDMCRDPFQALQDLISLQVDRLLTSGQQPTCAEGAPLIAQLQTLAQERIIIMPGGGLNLANARSIVDATRVTEIHLSAREPVESRMKFRNPRCAMGVSASSEFTWKTTSASVVRQIVSAVNSHR